MSGERAEDFGRYGGGERRGRIDQFDGKGVEPIRGSIPARATPASLTPGAGGSGATRPPTATENRPVVATRAPRDPSRGLRNAGIPATSVPKTSPTRMVPAPPKGGRNGDSPQVSRPPFGTRGGNERQEPPAPPPYRGSGGSTRTSTGKPILVQPRASGSSPIMRPSSRPSSRPLTQPHVQPQAQPPSRPSLPHRSSSGSVTPRQSSAPSSARSAPSSVRPSRSVRTAPAPSPTPPSSSGGSGSYSSQQRSASSVHSTPSPSGIGRSSSSLPGVPANRVFGGSGGKR